MVFPFVVLELYCYYDYFALICINRMIINILTSISIIIILLVLLLLLLIGGMAGVRESSSGEKLQARSSSSACYELKSMYPIIRSL